MKFNILVPQISFHLLREDTTFPDYGNLSYKLGDYPFKYPTVEHPSTILLIGSSTIPEGLVENLAEWRKNGTIKKYCFSKSQTLISQFPFHIFTEIKVIKSIFIIYVYIYLLSEVLQVR